MFFQAEDGIRDLVRSRGLGDVYKRQLADRVHVDLDERRDIFLPVTEDDDLLDEGARLHLSLIHI